MSIVQIDGEIYINLGGKNWCNHTNGEAWFGSIPEKCLCKAH